MSRSLNSKAAFGKAVSKGMVKASMKPKSGGSIKAYRSAQSLIRKKSKG